MTMRSQKKKVRGVFLDIITGREKIKYDAIELGGLQAGVAEVLYRRIGKPVEDHPAYPPQSDS
jgi:hypothetical protein